MARSEFIHEVYEPDFIYGTLFGARIARDPLVLSDRGTVLDGAFYTAFQALRECEESGEYGHIQAKFIIAPHPIHGDSPVVREEISVLWAHDILRGEIGRRLDFRPVESMDVRVRSLSPMWAKLGKQFLNTYDENIVL